MQSIDVHPRLHLAFEAPSPKGESPPRAIPVISVMTLLTSLV